MPYRPDIDGLRALAVIGVILFHADLGLDGGFVGVDVFFVISGFLITSLILKDLKSNQFSILGFWERRARRIFPALFTVTLVTICASYLFLLPRDFELLGGSVIWLSLFCSNIFFWKNTNSYFSGAAEEVPLLHTWSLSLLKVNIIALTLGIANFQEVSENSPCLFLVPIGKGKE